MAIFTWDEIGFDWQEVADDWAGYDANVEWDASEGEGWNETARAFDRRMYRSERHHLGLAIEADTMEAAHGKACTHPSYLEAINA